MRSKPGVAGTYGIGRISAKSNDVFNFREKEQVLVVSDNGTWNDDVVVSSKRIFSFPPLDDQIAALLPDVASAHAILHNFVKLSAGDVVVITDHATTINTAIQQICKKLGVKTVVASEANLNDNQFKSKVSAMGPVRLAVTFESGKRARALGHLLNDNGVLVTYNGFIQTLQNTVPIELPISPLIFQNQSVRGFDFATYAHQEPEKCDDTIRTVASMIGTGEIVLTPKIYSQDKVLDAIEAASVGESVVLIM